MHTTLALSSALLLTLLGGSLHARAIDPPLPPAMKTVAGPHVRGTSPHMSRLLEQAIKQSPTFAALVTALDKTDVIVHVEEVTHMTPGVDGRLTFVVATGDVRYLRAQVLKRGVIDMMSVVGHELQHALEVALASDVRCQASFAGLYNRIGDQPARPDRYDTAAAREAGQRVRRELS